MACSLISSICMEVTPSTRTENVSKECLEVFREAGHILELAFKFFLEIIEQGTKRILTMLI